MTRVPPFLRWLAGGLTAVAALTVVFALKGDGQPVPLPAESSPVATPTATSTPLPDLERLLVQVTDDELRTVGTAVLVRDGDVLTAVTLDPQVVVDFGQVGLQTLRDAGPIVPLTVMQDALARNTGIRIDGVFTLQRLALAGLVDSVGGVTIDAPRPLQVGPDPSNPEWVTGGRQVLPGAVAADYALYRGPREREEARTARFADVLIAVMSALPRDTGSAKDVIAALGSTSRTTAPTPVLAEFLVDLNAEGAWKGVTVVPLPTVPSQLERAPGSTWLRLDLAGTSEVVGAFGGLPNAEPLRVVVVGGTPAERLELRDRLRESGQVFIDGGGTAAAATTVTLDAALPTFPTRDFVVKMGLDVTEPATSEPGLFGDVLVTLAGAGNDR